MLFCVHVELFYFKGVRTKISVRFWSGVGFYRLLWLDSVIYMKQESSFLDRQYSLLILKFSFHTTEIHYTCSNLDSTAEKQDIMLRQVVHFPSILERVCYK